MKLLNKILNKVSSSDFDRLHKATGALTLIASKMTNDEDVLSSFYVLAFDDVPNKKLSLSENVDLIKKQCKNLNLTEKHIIAKDVIKNLKDASKYYDSELDNLLGTVSNFNCSDNLIIIKNASFGKVAIIDGNLHIVNPITNKVTSNYIKNASSVSFANLHKIIGEYRKQGKITQVSELDNDLVITSSKEVCEEIKPQLENLGYSVELVNEENTNDNGEQIFALRIKDGLNPNKSFDNIKSEVKEDSLEKQAEPDNGLPRTFGYETIYKGDNLKVEVHIDDTNMELNKPTGEYVFYANKNVLVADQRIIANKDGYALDSIQFYDGDSSKKIPSTLENNEPAYTKFGITEDSWLDATKAVQDDFKTRYEESNPTQDLKGVEVDKIDATNPNVLKDNPTLTEDEAIHTPFEKATSKDSQLSKKADGEDWEPSYPDRVGDDISHYCIFPKLGNADSDSIRNDKYIRDEFRDIPTLDEAKSILDNFDPKVYRNYSPNGNNTLTLRIYKGNDDAAIYPTEFSKTFKVDTRHEDDLIDIDEDELVFGTYSNHKPQLFIVDASEESNIKVYANNKLINTCKDIKSALEDSYSIFDDPKDYYLPKGEPNPTGASVLHKEYVPQKGEYIGDEWIEARGEDPIEEPKDVEVNSSKNKNLSKKAEELEQFNTKQELDGQKEFETQDTSLKDVSIPEEKEDTSLVNEEMSAKPESKKEDSFSASELGKNLAYIKQNKPEDFNKIMQHLEQILVGDEKKILNFLKTWSEKDFQDFTSTTREDPSYARHSQYQEQLKNNVLPKLKEMSEYKSAMEDKVKAEKGTVNASMNTQVEVPSDTDSENI